jgi:hypothetical protein
LRKVYPGANNLEAFNPLFIVSVSMLFLEITNARA